MKPEKPFIVIAYYTKRLIKVYPDIKERSILKFIIITSIHDKLESKSKRSSSKNQFFIWYLTEL